MLSKLLNPLKIEAVYSTSDYLQARVEALQEQLELQNQIDAVSGKMTIDPKRAIHILQHLNNKYQVPMTHIAERLGVTREWLRKNFKEEKLSKPMQKRVQSMVEDMISDLQLTLVEEIEDTNL